MQTNDCIHHILSSQELVGPSHIHLTVALGPLHPTPPVYQVPKGDPISLAEALGAQTQNELLFKKHIYTAIISQIQTFILYSTKVFEYSSLYKMEHYKNTDNLICFFFYTNVSNCSYFH